MDDQMDFQAFLSALRDADMDPSASRDTRHTSSVTTADWERVQAAFAGRR